MREQLKSEWIKLTTTKLWLLLLAGMTGFCGWMTAFIAFAAFQAPRSPVDLDSPGATAVLYNMPVGIAYVFPLALGVLLVTQEYHSGTIVPTLLAEPRRRVVYLGKCGVAVAASFVYALVSVGTCVLVGGVMVATQGEDPQLTDGEVLGSVLSSLAVLTLWGAVGVGIGSVVRRQVPAIVGIVMINQFVEPILRLAADQAGSPRLGFLLPGGAGDAASGGTIVNQAGGLEPPSPVTGFLVLGIYVAVVLLCGERRFRRHEFA